MTDPLLIKATLKRHTHDEDRDHDSCINAEARTSDHKILIAAAHLSECQGQYGDRDHETHESDVPLTPEGKKLRLSQCHEFQFRMGITPTGDDTWKFDAWLILHFEDGTTYWNDKIDQVIDASNVWNAKSPMYQCDWNYSHIQPPPLGESEADS